MNTSRSRKTKLRPQEYEHRVGSALEALMAALSAAQLLVAFCLEQEGPEWQNQMPKALQARRELQHARTWLKGIDRHD